MKILSKYVLREHIGPLLFALVALTALMLLNFISRSLGDLVGKGLPWSVVGEFFLLSVPFTIALTVPMSVLVAVLYAFSRLASENEVTALKASGVSPWTLVSPALAGGVFMSLALLAFNDQVLPRTNHQLKTLQEDISQAKPTLLLKDNVINPISEGKLYLRAGHFDRTDSLGRMTHVVIYDLADPARRRTIYADSGRIAFASNRVDIDMDLFSGEMQGVSTEKPGQLDRLFFKKDRIKVRGVGGGGEVKLSEGNGSAKGDREMTVCEMQKRLWISETSYQTAKREYDRARAGEKPGGPLSSADPPPGKLGPEPHGIGWAYCRLIEKVFSVKPAEAAEVPQAQSGTLSSTLSSTPATTATTAQQVQAEAARAIGMSLPSSGLQGSRIAETKLMLEQRAFARNRYEIEIYKKFSLAAACLIFVILAAPLAVRFPRGGVGLVIGVSLIVFALYYVGLIGGEALANKGLVSPFLAMWGTNIIMTVVGIVLLFRMGRDSNTGRGGSWSDRIDRWRRRFGDDRSVKSGAAT